MINWFEPNVSLDDLKLVKKCFKDNYINEGDVVFEFEKKCKQLLNSEYALSTTSGTIAIYIALKSIGINYGDEVLVPNLSYIAAANAINMTGARPVFVGIDKKNLLIETSKLKNYLTKKTKAIIPVHVSGRGSNIIEIVNFAKRNNLYVIEDAAEAFYSKFQDKFLGTFGDIGCFSFSPNKIITTGQGGLITTRNRNIYEYIKMYKNQGRSIMGTGGDDKHHIKGSNLRLTNIQAAVGLTQLTKIKRRKKILIDNHNFYLENLNKVKNIHLFKFTQGELPLWTDAYCDNRNALINFLKKKEIDCRKFWIPIDYQGPYLKKKNKLDNFFFNLFWLPSSFLLNNNKRQKICNQIKAFFKV